MNTSYIFSIKKNGHYADYAQVLSTLLEAKVIESTFKQLLISFSSSSIVFLDGDSFHLLFSPLIIIRSWLGFENFLFSIRTERIIDVKLQKIIKLPVYWILKKTTTTKIISIHKDNIRGEYHKFITDFIFDIQYWDLKFIKTQSEKPHELTTFNFSNTISIIGEFNNKKSREELLDFLKKNKGFNFSFLFVGKIFKNDLSFLNKHPNCIVVDRYVSNEEIFYVYEKSKIIWCFYSEEVERPSGIFGRAMQLKKQVVVRQSGHLYKSNNDYPYFLRISKIEELLNYEFDFKRVTNWENSKDSSSELLKLFNK